MIENPKTPDGKDEFFPGALAVDVQAHRERAFAYVCWIADFDPRFARWRAGTYVRDLNEWHHDLLKRLDEYLASKGIPKPAPYREPESQLLALVQGKRAFPPRESFIDQLKKEFPCWFQPH